jgi:cytochrome P450 PksS
MAEARAADEIVFAYGTRDSLWLGLGGTLLKAGGAIIDTLSRADSIIKSRVDWSLLEFLRSNGPLEEFMVDPMNTAIQLALTAGWRERGIEPAAVLARCGGEFAGAHVSGAIGFDDALDLACRVSNLIGQGRGAGKMLGLFLSESEVKLLSDACPVPFALISEGPDNSILIACEAGDLVKIEAFITKRQIRYFLLRSGVAPHSWVAESWKDGMLHPLRQNLGCAIPFYSSAAQGRLTSRIDWMQHFWRLVREPVFIRPAIRSALDDGLRCFVEIGGRPTLREFIVDEAQARNLHVGAFATMEAGCSLHQVMNWTEGALKARRQPRVADMSTRSPALSPSPDMIRGLTRRSILARNEMDLPPGTPTRSGDGYPVKPAGDRADDPGHAAESSEHWHETSRAPASPAASEPVDIQFDRANPYPIYARLRRIAPVLPLNWPELGPTWVVTRYRDGVELLKDPRFVKNPVNAGRRECTGGVRGFGRDLLELDPPDHTRLRALVGRAFTSQMVKRFEGRITQVAGQVLDRVERRGEMELISEYASVIPMTIISELLGVPINDMGGFRNFIYALTIQQMSGRNSDRLIAAKSRFSGHLRHVFEERRVAPQDDLVSSLVKLEQAHDRLSEDELFGMVYLLLVAGFVTTVNLIGNGILALLRHPEQLNMFRRNPALAAAAVEELLRFDGPLTWSAKCFASTDVDWSGIRIPRGAPVRVLIASANRDEEEFPRPDVLDITRGACQHLSFGQGVHYCLGAPLARLEGAIALRMLIERLPDLRLVDPTQVRWLPDPMLRGLLQLSIRF